MGEHRQGQGASRGAYIRLAAMAAVSFASMYVLMYAMVDRWENVHPSLNQAYMAGLMTAPMVLVELLLMGSMYPAKRANAVLLVASAAALVAFWCLIRTQAGIGDREFVKSMVPHHSGAILMCSKAPLSDEGLKRLCATIVRGQQEEIDEMHAKLRALEGGR